MQESRLFVLDLCTFIRSLPPHTQTQNSDLAAAECAALKAHMGKIQPKISLKKNQ